MKQKEKVKLILKQIEDMRKLGSKKAVLSNEDYESLFEYLHPHHVKAGFELKGSFHYRDILIQSLERNYE